LSKSKFKLLEESTQTDRDYKLDEIEGNHNRGHREMVSTQVERGLLYSLSYILFR